MTDYYDWPLAGDEMERRRAWRFFFQLAISLVLVSLTILSIMSLYLGSQGRAHERCLNEAGVDRALAEKCTAEIYGAGR